MNNQTGNERGKGSRGKINGCRKALIPNPSLAFRHDDEVAAVWAASHGPYGDIVKLLILTGARRSEVAEMTFAELDLQNCNWSLPAARAKNGRSHSVPLSDQALAILEKLPRGNGVVFEPQSFSREKAALDALLPGVPAFTIHDLRRTFASGCASLGVQPHVIEACLNHKSGTIRGVAAVYNRFNYATEKRAALELWSEHVKRLVTAPEGLPVAA